MGLREENATSEIVSAVLNVESKLREYLPAESWIPMVITTSLWLRIFREFWPVPRTGSRQKRAVPARPMGELLTRYRDLEFPKTGGTILPREYSPKASNGRRDWKIREYFSDQSDVSTSATALRCI